MVSETAKAITFTDSSVYDSDGEDDAPSFTASTSSSASGVILGFEDGELLQSNNGNNDESILSISRIGGRAYFPLDIGALPPADLSLCPLCSYPMPLLVQLYAPLADEQLQKLHSPHPYKSYRDEFDRLLYIFGCVVKGCTGLRFIRAARRNEAWAAEGRSKRKRKREESEQREKQKLQDRNINPFMIVSTANDESTSTDHAEIGHILLLKRPSASSSTAIDSASNDLGSLIFGFSSEKAVDEKARDNVALLSDDVNSKVRNEEFPSSSEPSVWPQSPLSDTISITPRYLTTSYEQITSKAGSKSQLTEQMGILDLDDPKEFHKGGRTKKSNTSEHDKPHIGGSVGKEIWSSETYEIMKVSGVDEVFLGFQERLELSGAADQIVRYEFSGTPLPFSAKSKPYQLLYTSTPSPGSLLAISRSSHSNLPSSQDRSKRFDSGCSALPKCPYCQSPRTFELQLMPHLCSIVERDLNKCKTEKGQEKELGWATLWCFVCSADCLEARDTDIGMDESLDWQGWREEIALFELED